MNGRTVTSLGSVCYHIKDVHYQGVSINKDSTVVTVVVAIMTSCSFYEYHV